MAFFTLPATANKHWKWEEDTPLLFRIIDVIHSPMRFVSAKVIKSHAKQLAEIGVSKDNLDMIKCLSNKMKICVRELGDCCTTSSKKNLHLDQYNGENFVFDEWLCGNCSCASIMMHLSNHCSYCKCSLVQLNNYCDDSSDDSLDFDSLIQMDNEFKDSMYDHYDNFLGNFSDDSSDDSLGDSSDDSLGDYSKMQPSDHWSEACRTDFHVCTRGEQCPTLKQRLRK